MALSHIIHCLQTFFGGSRDANSVVYPLIKVFMHFYRIIIWSPRPIL